MHSWGDEVAGAVLSLICSAVGHDSFVAACSGGAVADMPARLLHTAIGHALGTVPRHVRRAVARLRPWRDVLVAAAARVAWNVLGAVPCRLWRVPLRPWTG
jgi:GMP synthase PP-ATPase subunit